MFYRHACVIQLFIFLWSVTLSAQDQVTTLTTTGSGPSKEIAVQQSLRSAIEQAFGAFISANTEILNDELISDEITSISSGNIQEYELLSEVYNPEASSYFVTTKVTVSVSKLTSFVQSKGVEVEIKGALFVANIIQQDLNAKAEFQAIKNMLVPFHEAMLQAYDYNLTVSNPVLEDNESNKWKIILKVKATSNDNFNVAYGIIENTLKGVSLSQSEAEEYLALGKEVYPVSLWKDDYARFIGYKESDQIQDWPSGTLISEIAEYYNVSIDDVKARLTHYYSNRHWSVRGTGEKQRIHHSLKIPFDARDFSWRNPTNEVIYLRNERSSTLLKETLEKHLDYIYGNHFDVLSNVHNYYSFPDVEVTLDPSRLEKIGSSLVFKGDTSTIGIFFNNWPDDFSALKRSYVMYQSRDHSLFRERSRSSYYFPKLLFHHEREFNLIDKISFEDLSRLQGYTVSESTNVFPMIMEE